MKVLVSRLPIVGRSSLIARTKWKSPASFLPIANLTLEQRTRCWWIKTSTVKARAKREILKEKLAALRETADNTTAFMQDAPGSTFTQVAPMETEDGSAGSGSSRCRHYRRIARPEASALSNFTFKGKRPGVDGAGFS
jgi:hypothetical protein